MMTRRLLNLLTALSLLLCVAVAALWVRARRSWDILHVRLPAHVAYVSTQANGLGIGWWRRDEHDIFFGARLADGAHPLDAPSVDDEVHFTADGPGVRHTAPEVTQRDIDWASDAAPYIRWKFAGFYGATGRSSIPVSWIFVGIPLWFPLAVSCALPLSRAAATVRRRRRVRLGLCPACGYDLCATPDKCPECGKRTQNAE